MSNILNNKKHFGFDKIDTLSQDYILSSIEFSAKIFKACE